MINKKKKTFRMDVKMYGLFWAVVFFIFEFISDDLCRFGIDDGTVVAVGIFEGGQPCDHRQQRQHDKVKHYNEN